MHVAEKAGVIRPFLLPSQGAAVFRLVRLVRQASSLGQVAERAQGLAFTLGLPQEETSMSEKELSGKVVLITGAAKNIGRATALAFAADGAAVAVNALTSKEEGESLVKEIRDAGGQAGLFLADIADGAAVKAMVEGIIAQFGRLDMLVLNASYRKETPFLEMSFEQWRHVLSLSLDGAFHCVKNALPHMIKAGGGSIVRVDDAGQLHVGPRSAGKDAALQEEIGGFQPIAHERKAVGNIALLQSAHREAGIHEAVFHQQHFHWPADKPVAFPVGVRSHGAFLEIENCYGFILAAAPRRKQRDSYQQLHGGDFPTRLTARSRLKYG